MGQLAHREQRDVGMAYILWLGSLFGIAGLHRFYLGRWASGLVWLFTYGLCGLGLVIDLIYMPRMVEDHAEGRSVW